MSNSFDETVASAPTSREAGHTQPYGMGHQPQPYYGGPEMYGYGAPMFGRRYGGGFGYGGMRMNRGPIETKPFFLTSEFVATLLCVIAVAITAASVADLDSRLSTALISGLVAAYTISRGIAKSGTRSRAFDPREDLFQGQRGQHDHEHAGT
jgi:hypothetical protein